MLNINFYRRLKFIEDFETFNTEASNKLSNYFKLFVFKIRKNNQINFFFHSLHGVRRIQFSERERSKKKKKSNKNWLCHFRVEQRATYMKKQKTKTLNFLATKIFRSLK